MSDLFLWFFAIIGNPSFWLIVLSGVMTFYYNSNKRYLLEDTKWEKNVLPNNNQKEHDLFDFDHLIYLSGHFSAFLVASVLFLFDQIEYITIHNNQFETYKDKNNEKLLENFEPFLMIEFLGSIILVITCVVILAIHFKKFKEIEKKYSDNNNQDLFSIPFHYASWARVIVLVCLFLFSLFSVYISVNMNKKIEDIRHTQKIESSIQQTQ